SAAQSVLSQVLADRSSVPPPPASDENHGLVLWDFRWIMLGPNAGILRFEVVNYDPRAYRVAELQLFDEFKLKNRAFEAKLGHEPKNDGLLATIRGGGQASGAIYVHDLQGVGRYFHISIREPDGGRPVMHEKVPTWYFTPPPDP